MANASGRKVDTTHLSWEQTAERLIFHRDTQAHFMRWSHVLKYLQNSKHRGEARVLELGCGKELPLPRLLYSNKCVPKAYCGVDYRKNLDRPEMLAKVIESGKFNFKLLPSQDAATVSKEQIGFTPDVIVSFECIEHVEPLHARNILLNARYLLATGGVMFLSTPCYDANVGAADNHVSEITYQALGSLLEDLGFTIDGVWGTFASIRDYETALAKQYGKAGTDIFNKLREYYDTNILANVFAPLFPEHSRNALWQLSYDPQTSLDRRYPPLADVKGPWTSSAAWATLAG